MECQKNIKRITVLDGFSFPEDDDFSLNDSESKKDSAESAFKTTAVRQKGSCTIIIRLHS